MSASSQAPFPVANAVPMTDTEKKLVTQSIEAARQALFQHGELFPQVLLQNEEGEIALILGEPFNGEESKDRFAMMIRVMSLKHKACALVYISEAWAFDTNIEGASLDDFEKWRADNEKGESFSKYPGVGVVEQVLIMLESHTGMGHMGANIHRTPDNTPYIDDTLTREMYFTHEQIEEYGKPVVTGRFTNMLAPKSVWANPNNATMIDLAMRLFSGYVHDQDSDLVKKLREAADKADNSIPRDLQN